MRFSEPGVQMLDLNANPHQFAPFSMPRPATNRTAPTETTMRIIRIRAPAQACRCHSSNGEMAYVNICNGRAAVGWFTFQFQYWLPKAVNKSGAVSPATRAKASITPVITPEVALRNVMERVVRQ